MFVKTQNSYMKKILIVEDDCFTVNIYRSLLEKEGYQVWVAPDGQIGYDLFVEAKPDGLLVDLMLPKINGIDLVKKVRALAGLQKLPIIAYTNAFIPALIDRVKAAGADHVFEKGNFTPGVLTTAFREGLA